MANRITKGQALVGDLEAVTATIGTLDVTTPKIGSAAVTSTAAELNLADLSVVGAIRKVKKITVAAGTATSADQSSGWSLPAKGIVHDVWIDISAASTVAAAAINVGLYTTSSGDLDGFLASVNSTTTGVKIGYITSGSSGYVPVNYGIYLCTTPSVNTSASAQFVSRTFLNLANTPERLVSYSASTTNSPALAFKIYVDYTEIA
jgi:hypothetical protein